MMRKRSNELTNKDLRLNIISYCFCFLTISLTTTSILSALITGWSQMTQGLLTLIGGIIGIYLVGFKSGFK
jgi:hypothetical protein